MALDMKPYGRLDLDDLQLATGSLRIAHKHIETVTPETDFEETLGHISDAIAMIRIAAMHLEHFHQATVAEAICEIGKTTQDTTPAMKPDEAV